MQSIRQVARLNELELEKCTAPNASWHTDYRDTAYIYIGGLPFELSEGDILTVFSQYGNPAHINLVRDKDTGKSRGFCFLKYEDQRSCDLAVDNLSGAMVMGRMLSVDHTRYKRKDGEVEKIDDDEEEAGEPADDTDREDQGGRERRQIKRSESPEKVKERPLLKEEVELQKLLKEHDDDDPMKAYLVKQKKEEIAEAQARAGDGTKDREHRRRHRHRHRSSSRDRDDDRRDRHRSRRERDKDNDEDRARESRRTHPRPRSRSPDEAQPRPSSTPPPKSERDNRRRREDRDVPYRRDRSRTRDQSQDRNGERRR